MSDPAEALQRLGLSKYEAEVFVGLRQLGAATARDVADVADVPRSQVYGAAEDLAERGLVDVQHASPKRYRAVSLDAAREQLRRDFEREHERAFDALADLETRLADGEERQEELWTISGRETVTARVASLVEEAEAWVVYGGDEALFAEAVIDALTAGADDCEVTAVSVDEAVADLFGDDPVEVVVLPESFQREGWPNGRFLVVDDSTVLLSVVGPDGEESAFWSSDTDFAAGLIRLVDGYFGRQLDL